MLGTLGWQELLIILVILALLFGASRVSDLGGALGRGIREFRQEARSEDEDEEEQDQGRTVQAGSPSSSDGSSSDNAGSDSSD